MSIKDISDVREAKNLQMNRLFAGGSIAGAILASSCCIVPLVLLVFGVSGAWIGNLTALEPYRPYFISATLIFLALGYWHIYFKPRIACEGGSYCESPKSGLIIKATILLATILILIAATMDYWAPYF